MLRIVSGVIAGFLAWLMAWFCGETILSAIGPEWFGVQQRAFEAAIVAGGDGFTADTRLLLTHVVLGAIVSALAGFLAALVAGERRRAPLVLGILLLALGVSKAVMSWPLVPVWYHIVFTAMLAPLAILGGRLGTTRPPVTPPART